MFLGNPAQQNLSEPQSLNSYAYAEDNPISHFDPNGKDQFSGSDPFASDETDILGDLILSNPETIAEGAVEDIGEGAVEDAGDAEGSLADIPSIISELSGGFEDVTTDESSFPIPANLFNDS